MKKLNIFLTMALALCFASCEEEWVEALPQTNEQEALFTAEDFVANNALAEAITLSEAEGENSVEVVNFVSVSNLPAGAVVEFGMQMAKNEDFSDAVEVKVSNVGNAATAKVADLQTAYVAVQGKNPEARTVNVRYAAYVVNGTEKVRVNSADTYFGAAKVVVTPYDPGFRMENKYYIIWAEDADALAEEANVVELGHSDKDVYDDTKFSVIVDITPDQVDAGFWWVVVPQSTIDAGAISDAADAVYGVIEGEEGATSGMLITNSEEEKCFAAIASEAGKYQFSINMYSKIEGLESDVYREYAITPAFDNLWTPGSSNGWNHANSNMLATTDYITYTGYAYLTGDFKFSNAADWNHTNYGKTDVEGELSTDGGAGNLPCAEAGLYWCSVNIPNLTYTLTKIEKVGLIGGFNGWADVVAMTESITAANDIKYTGTIEVTSVENGGNEFKFRMTDDWAVNLGGTVDNLTNGAGNLKVEEVGTYEVVLDLSSLPYTCTVTKK